MRVEIRDPNREIDYINTSHSARIAFGVNGEYTYTAPTFYVTQARRDENTNALTIHGYCVIWDAAKFTVGDLEIAAPYSIQQFAQACATLVGATGVKIKGVGSEETCFTAVYEKGGNFDGSETIREALNDVAEATQTVYYIDADNYLVFKRLNDDAQPDLTITKADYIKLESKNSRRLKTITHTTELGDNVSASIAASGTTVYVRENAFWTASDDIGTLLDNAAAAVCGLTINQFECEWRGNYLLEVGDKIALTQKDDSIVYSYILDDVIEYDGVFQEKSGWEYTTSDAETEAHPTTLGEVLKQTYAKVDKVQQEIELVVKDIESVPNRITELEMTVDGMELSVKEIGDDLAEVESNLTLKTDLIEATVENLENRVSQTLTPDEIEILIENQIKEGEITTITTSTGFTFNEKGLTVSKTGAEMATIITEDGMRINRNDAEVLTVNHFGVKAENLHATTYLIIGGLNRFEEYEDANGETRIGAFWLVE
jgi:hypothetical protein